MGKWKFFLCPAHTQILGETGRHNLLMGSMGGSEDLTLALAGLSLRWGEEDLIRSLSKSSASYCNKFNSIHE